MRWLIVAALALLAACASSVVGAVPDATPTASAQLLLARGEALFVNKGCSTCHQNDTIAYRGLTVGAGPNLTQYTATEAFLRSWLADPAAVRPNSAMPKLALDAGEIDALIAVINRTR